MRHSSSIFCSARWPVRHRNPVGPTPMIGLLTTHRISVAHVPRCVTDVPFSVAQPATCATEISRCCGARDVMRHRNRTFSGALVWMRHRNCGPEIYKRWQHIPLSLPSHFSLFPPPPSSSPLLSHPILPILFSTFYS